MSNFLRLSKRIINVAHIVEIWKYNKKEVPMFMISLNKTNYTGMMFFGSGGFDNKENEIDVSSKTDFEDYKRIEDWMTQNNLNL